MSTVALSKLNGSAPALLAKHMNVPALLQFLIFLGIVALLVKPVGIYLERVFTRERTFLDPLLAPVERMVYRFVCVDPNREMDWKHYSLAFVLFGGVNTALLYLLLRCQAWLPWFQPEVMTAPMTPDLAANTAVSFMTTTTWQAYAGENTLSLFQPTPARRAKLFRRRGGAGRRHRVRARLRPGENHRVGQFLG